MNNDLEEMVRKRVNEAIDKKIFEKATTIARYLTETVALALSNGGSDYPQYGSFHSRHFTITEGSYYTTVEYKKGILHKRKIVFRQSFNGPIIIYTPGEWKQEFEEIYAQAQKAKRRFEEAIEKKREADLRRRFGINL